MLSNRTMAALGPETVDAADSQIPATAPKLPPHSFNEWLDWSGIKEWPLIDSSQLTLHPDNVIGTQSDIKDDLRRHSSKILSFAMGLAKLDQIYSIVAR